MISVENVSYVYENKREIIQDISTNFEKGKVTCVLGPSGCGKTTLLRIIAGMNRLYHGKVIVDGQDAGTYFERKRMGYVAQRYANFEWLTVKQNIALGCKQKTEREVTQLLKDLGLEHVAHHYPKQLSGGMQQRVAIGRCIAQGAEYIALDEPFGALDPETKMLMQDFLLRQVQKYNVTILMVTHDIEEALYVADTILLMGGNPGTIVQRLDVSFGKPRQYELRFSKDFEKAKKVLYSTMYSETMKLTLQKESPAKGEKCIKIALPIWAGAMPIFLAQVTGTLRQGVLPFYLDSFTDHQKKLEKFLSGDIDICHMTLDVFLKQKQERDDLVMLFPAGMSRGADAILAKEGIHTVQDLKGKRIGAVRDDLSTFFLHYVLKRNGLREEDVFLEEGPIDRLAHAFVTGKIDAVMLWEPWLSKTKYLAHRQEPLVSTIEYPILYDVFVTTKKIIEQYPDQITVLKESWDGSVEYYEKFSDETVELVSSSMGLSSIELMRQLKNVSFYRSSEHIPAEYFNEIERYFLT